MTKEFPVTTYCVKSIGVSLLVFLKVWSQSRQFARTAGVGGEDGSAGEAIIRLHGFVYFCHFAHLMIVFVVMDLFQNDAPEPICYLA